MTNEQHILAETDLEPAVKRLIRLSLAFAVQPEIRRAVMLNLKRKVIAIAILAIPAALASAQSGNPRTIVTPEDIGYFGPVDGMGRSVRFASPADHPGSVRLGLLGTQGQGRPDSTIKIGSTTGNIYVDHLATARIENDKGQSFTWQFDSTMSVSTFPLKTIAPGGFDAGNVQVTILHPAIHLAP